MKLRIAENLTLPIEVVTEKLAFLGRTGSGKTYAAMKLAELMLEAGAQIVSLDPVGAWHGLRIGGPWNVYIFGGMRGDFPLEPTGGKLMADIVADRGISAVLDISQFIRAEQVRFASDFIEQFFHRKKAAPSAVHLFLEECQEFVPQNPGDREAHMLHHFERAWKLGRNFGIGGSLISQRPQEINKKALNQAGTLFVFNMTGPQERRAIADWTRQAGIDEDIESVLPTLKTGEPHVWSPTFLEVSKTVKILPKLTADVSMTPKVGARTKEQPLTPIDVQKLTTDMAATIEKSKAEDPKELRKQILSLKQEIVSLKQQKPEAAAIERVEVSILTDEDRKQFEGLAGIAMLFMTDLSSMQGVLNEVKQLCDKAARIQPNVKLSSTSLHLPKTNLSIVHKPERQSTAIKPQQNGNSELGKCARTILQVLAQYPHGCPVGKLTLLTGYRYSGGFKNSLSELRQAGFITGDNTATMFITDAGMTQGPFDPMPSGDALIQFWLNHRSFGQCERRILSELVEHRKGLTAEQLCERTAYQYSGGFKNALSNLRTAGVLVGRNTEVMRASETLFE